MENTTGSFDSIEGEIVLCPDCHGTGAAVSPNSQTSDPPCRLCEGMGLLDTGNQCAACGRPGFRHVKSQPCCNRKSCQKLLEGPEESQEMLNWRTKFPQGDPDPDPNDGFGGGCFC